MPRQEPASERRADSANSAATSKGGQEPAKDDGLCLQEQGASREYAEGLESNDHSARSSLRFLAVSFTLKTVVKICMLAAIPRHRTRCEVGGQEKRAPTLILANVNMFVVATVGEAMLVDAENDMPECHRGSAVNACERDGSTEESLHQPSVHFEASSDKSDLAASRKRERNAKQSDQCAGTKCPQIPGGHDEAS
jgi:hypothetical protein